MKLLDGHRFLNRHYVANATPLPNNASIAGNLLMVLLNGNNLWDVDGTFCGQDGSADHGDAF